MYFWHFTALSNWWDTTFSIFTLHFGSKRKRSAVVLGHLEIHEDRCLRSASFRTLTMPFLFLSESHREIVEDVAVEINKQKSRGIPKSFDTVLNRRKVHRAPTLPLDDIRNEKKKNLAISHFHRLPPVYSR